MSRFFTAGDSSSESSSSDEEELYSEEETTENLEDESDEDEDASDDDEDTSSSDSDDLGKRGSSKFLRDQVSSDESEDGEKVTVVKSAKDKRLEELEAVVKLIDNAQKINDWGSISSGKTRT